MRGIVSDDRPLDALVTGCSYHDFETNGPLIADALRERGRRARRHPTFRDLIGRAVAWTARA